MKGQVFTGLKDAKGRKLYNGDKIYYTYKDSCEKKGFGTITGTIVFENAAFVVKEESYTKYDWNFEMNKPMYSKKQIMDAALVKYVTGAILLHIKDIK